MKNKMIADNKNEPEIGREYFFFDKRKSYVTEK